jgi:hypothetical protein
MIENVEAMEVLLQASFSRAIKYLSTAIKDPQYDQYLQLGEKLAVASLKCFTVSKALPPMRVILIRDRVGSTTHNPSSRGSPRSSGTSAP